MFNDGLSLIISCEHGGTYIPKLFEHLFKGNKRIVNSHFGHDPGARELATTLHRKSRGLLFTSDLSRLICDMNRSPGNPKLFSKFTCCLSAGNKNYIRSHYYEHYRSPIERSIALNIDNGKKV
ncbi:MAG: N-formylglutamate amidohydrolase, partial [Nitrospirota bacterium]